MSQYQHYVPQFILRKYSDYTKPNYEDYVDKQQFDKALGKAKRRAGVNVLDFKDGFTKGRLRRSSCNKMFGLPDMYDAEIEIALSKLEQRVSTIIDAVENDFVNGKPATLIARPQKDLLRKFIFIMGYRNRNFHERFEGEKDDYNSNDRAELVAYMHEKGIKTPNHVWLETMRAFIDVDLGQEHECWYEWLTNHAYPADARWFWKNMTTSHLCFCTPESVDEEFMLTQNAYGVFEGPCSHRGWTDWHTFAPINHRLVIVMRNGFLGGIPNLPSNLAGVITRIATTSYPTLRFCSDGTSSSSHKFNPEDIFTFKFFHLPSTFVQRINSILIEEAVLTDMILYKSSSALRRALESYLGAEKPGFKIAIEKPREEGPEILRVDYCGIKKMDGAPEYERQAYLGMLERIARSLGSDCTAKFTLSTPQSIVVVPPLPPGFSARYKKLGFDGFVGSWLGDEAQALLISRLWIWTNHAVRTQSEETQKNMRRERLKLVCNLHPRRLWLHLRLMRLFTDRPEFVLTASRGEYLGGLVAEDNGGPEDVVIDCISIFSPKGVSRAMMRASGMRQYSELTENDCPSPLKDKYFMAAMAHVGSITDCDLPKLKQAAIKIEMDSNPLALKAAAKRLDWPEKVVHEMWIRYRVHQDFEKILGCVKLRGRTIQKLKELLFQLLYPLQ
ncbi:hypothetical protein LTR84_002573 [Exophiala bonariae]|uniref:DUF4238 domain-containing protein n=1 Tax=Exophiala bonariae TaxID=1690606 RepID=A0AAV9NA56_9EURO|nr:hypothetical protein LTR84_002573 [Exophiala bonariae]